jgi:hypothetical protein
MVHRIYVDEAGISAGEPVSVVAGVIVRDEEDMARIEEALAHVRRHVPTDIRDGFVFHASDLFHRQRGTPSAELCDEARGLILRELVAIPRALSVPLAVGYVRRGEPSSERTRRNLARVEHMAAFGSCLLSAARFMNYFAQGEIAEVIAEDCRDMRGLLREMPTHLRGPTAPEDWTSGISVECIPGPVQFVAKAEALPLQLADACAYTFRRHIGGLKHGATLFSCLTGSPFTTADLQAPVGHLLQVWRWRNFRGLFGLPAYTFPFGT